MTQAISKMETTQTAVGWLVKELTNLGYIYAPSFGHAIIDNKIEQAKAMEKEQIEVAYSNGSNDRLKNRINGQYYKETYGSKDL